MVLLAMLTWSLKLLHCRDNLQWCCRMAKIRQAVVQGRRSRWCRLEPVPKTMQLLHISSNGLSRSSCRLRHRVHPAKDGQLGMRCYSARWMSLWFVTFVACKHHSAWTWTWLFHMCTVFLCASLASGCKQLDAMKAIGCCITNFCEAVHC